MTHRNVYVIRLREDVRILHRFRARNPNAMSHKPCVYVGSSARSPDERFAQHLTGYKASRIVRKYGLALIPRLYARYNPMEDQVAREFEAELARRLKNRGYAVWQN